jgi:hypothetical protein
LAVQLERDVKPLLDKKNVKMYLVSIGTPERGLEFCKQTGFSPDRLLADPDAAMYPCFGFVKSVQATFFSKETPYAIWRDIQSGRIQDLKDVMKAWTAMKTLWIPPKQDQAFNQGGVVVFEGKNVLYCYKDPATGAHADLDEVVRIALDGL